LRVTGLDFDPAWTVPAPADAPELVVRLQPVDAPDATDVEQTVELLDGARLTLNADASRATFHVTPTPSPVELLHPWLAPAAVRRSLALGRLALHGGLLLAGGSALAVVGSREAGKSTLMSHAAAAGVPVLSDDIIVVDGGRVFSGPRCVDLRPGAAERFGHEHLEPARGGTRYRLMLPPAPWSAPLAGVVVLEWGDAGDDITLEPVRAAERLAVLAPHLACAERPAARRLLLGMADTPLWRLRRPRDFRLLSHTLEAVQDLAA
jgi:hypothetical protein